MKLLPLLLATSSLAIAVGGCNTIKTAQGAIEAEVGNSGGAGGYFADEVFPAYVKSAQVYRADVLAALITRVASAEKLTDAKIIAYSTYLDQFDTDENKATSFLTASNQTNCAFGSTVAPTAAADCRVWFESIVPTLEDDLVNLAETALPTDQFVTVSKELAGAQFLAAAQSLVTYVAKDLEVAHFGAAEFRSIEELHAQVLEQVAGKGGPPVSGETYIDDTQSALAYIRAFAAADGKSHAIWTAVVTSSNVTALDGIFSHADALIALSVNEWCGEMYSQLSTSDTQRFSATIGPAAAAGGATPLCKVSL